MTNTEINVLDHVNSYYKHLSVDEKIDYVYNHFDFDFGLSKMNEIREFFKRNQ
jgi:hypothetical protein